MRGSKASRDLIATFIEEEGADAIVVVFSSVKQNKTTTHIASFGNIHACRGLAEELYNQMFVGEECEEEEDDE